jgi:hypothetical protein
MICRVVTVLGSKSSYEEKSGRMLMWESVVVPE